MQQGLVYEGGRYPFTPIDRSSATATLSSGATPYFNGIVGTQWLDRATLRPVSCVSDDKYSGSPQRLLTSTLGDELKMSSNGTAIVYSFLKTRSRPFCRQGMRPTVLFGWAITVRGQVQSTIVLPCPHGSKPIIRSIRSKAVCRR